MTRRNKEAVDMAGDVVEEILLRLPVKSLLRFRCLSKSCKDLISTPNFICAHLHHSQSRFSRRRVITSFINDNPNLLLSSSPLPSIFDLHSPPIITLTPLPYSPSVSKFNFLIGSCNGMVCLTAREYDNPFFLVWNPSTRIFRILPPPLRNPTLPEQINFLSLRSCGFGYDCVHRTYKVVAVFSGPLTRRTFQTQVFDLHTGSWRRIQDFPDADYMMDRSGKFVSGTLNWLTNGGEKWCEHRIVSLDLGSEAYREIPQPDYEGEEGGVFTMGVGVFNNCLCLVALAGRHYTRVWSMEDYGNRESWIRIITIPRRRGEAFGYWRPLCASENEDEHHLTLIVSSYRGLALHNSNDLNLHNIRLPNSNRSMTPVLYIESLISPFESSHFCAY